MSQILRERGCGDAGTAAGQLLPAAAALAGGLVAAAGSLLLVRRLGHAFPQPPGPASVAAVCGTGLLIVALVDRARHPAAAPVAAILARLGLLLGVAAVALPPWSASPVALLVSTAAILAAAGACLGPLVRRGAWQITGRPHAGRRPVSLPTPPWGGAAAVPPTPAADATGGSERPAGIPAAGDGADDVMQRFERRGLADGGEQVDGMVRVTVPRGARLGWAHVGFCPPFPATPTVDVTTGYDGVEANVAAAEVLPWGVRVEVRLDEPAEETIDVPVELVARTAA